MCDRTGAGPALETFVSNLQLLALLDPATLPLNEKKKFLPQETVTLHPEGKDHESLSHLLLHWEESIRSKEEEH